MSILPFLVFKFCPFDNFPRFFPKHSCTPHNSVTAWDILMKPYRNVYQVNIMYHVQLKCSFVTPYLSLDPLVVFRLVLCNLHS